MDVQLVQIISDEVGDGPKPSNWIYSLHRNPFLFDGPHMHVVIEFGDIAGKFNEMWLIDRALTASIDVWHEEKW